MNVYGFYRLFYSHGPLLTLGVMANYLHCVAPRPWNLGAFLPPDENEPFRVQAWLDWELKACRLCFIIEPGCSTPVQSERVMWASVHCNSKWCKKFQCSLRTQCLKSKHWVPKEEAISHGHIDSVCLPGDNRSTRLWAWESVARGRDCWGQGSG